MPRARFLVVCLNPVIQNTLVFGHVREGEVNRSSEHRVDASGKGVNVARVLGQTGQRAVHLSQLGGPTRDWFLSMCAADGIDARWAESRSEIRICTTVVDRGARSATELVQEARMVGEGTFERVLAEFERALPDCEAVVLSGTKAAGFPEEAMPALAQGAARSGKALFLDLKGADLLACLPFRPVIAKPNLEELIHTFARGTSLRGEDQLAAKDFVASVGRDFAESYGASLVVTRGRNSTWYWSGSALRECPALEVEALNPIGSGDSFMAGLASTLMEGAFLDEAVAEGTRLGALNAQRLKPGSIA
jgi:1-phosphofructokinase family hexose kinase